MSRGIADLIALVIIIGTLSACSHSKPPIVEDAVRQVPYELQVLKELNDGRNIYVAGQVVAHAQLDLEHALIRLSSWEGMQQVAETFFPLKSSSVQQQLDSARSKSMSKQYLFSLAVPAKNSSDYQLELLWGSEASTYLRKLGEPNQQSLLEVRNVQIQPCMAPDCLPLSISAELVNGGAERITSVKLGVGFSFLDNPPKLDSNGFLSENEEIVEIPALSLDPGQKRDLRIAVTSADQISDEQRSRLEPYIRILSYEKRS